MTSAVSFEVGDFEGRAAVRLTPVVDGVSLVELVGAFEAAAGYEVAGGYDGLVLDQFRFGDLDSYLLGGEDWPGRGTASLLGCDCGDVGCWPLDARVTVAGGRVVWDEFRQPHRPQRDYAGFGPFVFEEAAYRAAIDAAAAAVTPRS
ncbi:hypothetical protein [Cellulomonas sp. ICMP 17802]|uniref:hypothetical protein n=1 Tax=Cellulomonas sp. ICMP 17802 TaxID=3239199 RepID=UPI00351BCA58